MANTTPSNLEQASDWQLLAEFAATSLSSSGRSVADQITDAVQSLRLKPAQLDRIREAMKQALNIAIRNPQLAEHYSPVRIRIWSSLSFVEGGGWGFFIVEKPGIEPRMATVETVNMVELYLYQERHP